MNTANGNISRGWPRNPSPQDVAGIRAPCLWRVGPNFEVSISAASAGPVVKYRWQRPLVIIHYQLITRSALDTDLAALDLAWEDGQGDQVVSLGLASNGMFGYGGSGAGRGVPYSKWVPIEIPVKHNEVHTFQVTNNHASRAITPILVFQCVERATI